MLCYFLLYSKVNQLYIYIYPLFPLLSSSGRDVLLPSSNPPGPSPEPSLIGVFQHPSSAATLGLSRHRSYRRLGSVPACEVVSVQLPP